MKKEKVKKQKLSEHKQLKDFWEEVERVSKKIEKIRSQSEPDLMQIPYIMRYMLNDDDLHIISDLLCVLERRAHL